MMGTLPVKNYFLEAYITFLCLALFWRYLVASIIVSHLGICTVLSTDSRALISISNQRCPER